MNSSEKKDGHINKTYGGANSDHKLMAPVQRVAKPPLEFIHVFGQKLPWDGQHHG
jgi:hypothetical protein